MYSTTLSAILRNNMVKTYKNPYNYHNLLGKGIVVFRYKYNHKEPHPKNNNKYLKNKSYI